MNFIWAFIILIGILVATLTGKLNVTNEVILGDAQEAIVFAISLTGIMSVWLGLMNIAKKSGLIKSFGNLMKPLTKLLFPTVPPNHPALSAIIMNMVANMMGAGNSATALGLKAMEDLQSLNKNKRVASDAMCMFLVINMSSIQLIPLTVLKLRKDAGSIFPEEIIITSIIATAISTIVGILVCKVFEGRESY
ncbi:nucleoside recognition domain-containing protein [Alkaliphilus serpentinus]|uniref:Spore maturation protein n=1 Tax=Alkaliphilus serpentinus TaxID=1482731 RepID=A0A833HQE8_9FIRM|nr:nucleoside recognition domain-containing protein [Alkaliphilus serpentinus]KAB3531819.1 spore maturation protein [Alkaliphilus serpentinus]